MSILQGGRPETRSFSSEILAGKGRCVRWTATGLALLPPARVLLALVIGTGTGSAGGAWHYLAGDPAARADAQLRLAVLDVRLPRTLAAVLVGACPGTAGCLLQAATRNPLAETGLLGVHSGAAFTVVLGLTYFGAKSPTAPLGWAPAGGMTASVVVLLFAASGRRG